MKLIQEINELAQDKKLAESFSQPWSSLSRWDAIEKISTFIKSSKKKLNKSQMKAKIKAGLKKYDFDDNEEMFITNQIIDGADPVNESADGANVVNRLVADYKKMMSNGASIADITTKAGDDLEMLEYSPEKVDSTVKVIVSKLK